MPGRGKYDRKAKGLTRDTRETVQTSSEPQFELGVTVSAKPPVDPEPDLYLVTLRLPPWVADPVMTAKFLQEWLNQAKPGDRYTLEYAQ